MLAIRAKTLQSSMCGIMNTYGSVN